MQRTARQDGLKRPVRLADNPSKVRKTEKRNHEYHATDILMIRKPTKRKRDAITPAQQPMRRLRTAENCRSSRDFRHTLRSHCECEWRVSKIPNSTFIYPGVYKKERGCEHLGGRMAEPNSLRSPCQPTWSGHITVARMDESATNWACYGAAPSVSSMKGVGWVLAYSVSTYAQVWHLKGLTVLMTLIGRLP